ncbi:MAG: cell division protein FtsQ/DivIB [bacterium]|nr:cell division protein FtsQ/DivIB [bacterium]
MMRFIFKLWPVWTLVGLAAAAYLLPPLPPFQLKEVLVMIPPTRMTETELVRQSGVVRGDNLLTLSLREVRKNILKSPWIFDVHLAKSYPGYLIVSIREQEPVALVRGKYLHLVNHEGTLFKKLEAGDPKNLPVITGLDDFSKAALKPLTDLIAEFQNREELKEIGLSEIHWNGKKGVSIYTVRPVFKAVLGHTDWPERLTRLVQILPELRTGEGGPASVDLTYEKRVFVKRG